MHVYLYLSVDVSLGEGKRVVLRLQVKPDGQVDIKDPVIRANMLAKVISSKLMSACCEMLQAKYFNLINT